MSTFNTYKRKLAIATFIFFFPIIIGGWFFSLPSGVSIAMLFIFTLANWLFYFHLIEIVPGKKLRFGKVAIGLVTFFIPINIVLAGMYHDEIIKTEDLKSAKEVKSLKEIKDNQVYLYRSTVKPDINMGEIWNETVRHDRQKKSDTYSTTTYFVTPVPINDKFNYFLGCYYGHGLLSKSEYETKQILLEDELYVQRTKNLNYTNAAYTFREAQIIPYDHNKEFYVFEVLNTGPSLQKAFYISIIFLILSSIILLGGFYLSLRKMDRKE